MTENEISYFIRGSIFDIYNFFGPGLFENVYKQALYVDLTKKGLHVLQEVGVPTKFKEEELGLSYRIDLLVENKVLIEVKSIDELADIHHKQVSTYLKLKNIKLGILVNFNTNDLKKSIKRIVNNL